MKKELVYSLALGSNNLVQFIYPVKEKVMISESFEIEGLIIPGFFIPGYLLCFDAQ